MTNIRFYGLKNCDRCRAFNRWLSERHIEATLHDLRRDGLAREKLQSWADFFGLDVLVNRRGTTWRGLDDGEKETIDSGGDAAIDFLMNYPQMMKRPIIELDGSPFAIGFTCEVEGRLAQALGLVAEAGAVS